MVFLERKYQKNVFVTMENMIRLRYTFMSMLSGEPNSMGTNKVMPKISVVLKKAEPIMLPKAKLACPRKIDLTPMVNSGMLVPNATMVAPITV